LPSCFYGTEKFFMVQKEMFDNHEDELEEFGYFENDY
jgi:hypothetical protein